MELEYFKEKVRAWVLSKYGSFIIINITEPKYTHEIIDGCTITYCDSCKIFIRFNRLLSIAYKISVTPDLGELVFQKIS